MLNFVDNKNKTGKGSINNNIFMTKEIFPFEKKYEQKKAVVVKIDISKKRTSCHENICIGILFSVHVIISFRSQRLNMIARVSNIIDRIDFFDLIKMYVVKNIESIIKGI